MDNLVFNGQRFKFSDILNGHFQGAEKDAYLHHSLEFCHQWLAGQTIFEIHTSGSTGQPKKILLERSQMIHSARLTAKALGLQKGFKSLVCLNTQYIAGMMMLVRSFEVGMDIYLTEPRSNPMEVPSLQEVEFDFSAMVPLQIQSILHDPSGRSQEKINQMKAVLIGGAPVSAGLEKEMQQLTVPLYHTYGMTETISHIALRKINTEDRKDYFTVLEGIQIAQDERGCLLIKAPELHPEPQLITNDLVEILDAHSFRWIGRADNILNSGGVKVQSEKIEKVLEMIFYEKAISNRFFIAGIPDERLGQKVILVIESDAKEMPLQAELMELLKPLLSPYELPKNIVLLPRFIETQTAKVNKTETLKHYQLI